jgi:hypothetical protein
LRQRQINLAAFKPQGRKPFRFQRQFLAFLLALTHCAGAVGADAIGA